MMQIATCCDTKVPAAGSVSSTEVADPTRNPGIIRPHYRQIFPSGLHYNILQLNMASLHYNILQFNLASLHYNILQLNIASLYQPEN
jgi:hypothetical protein